MEAGGMADGPVTEMGLWSSPALNGSEHQSYLYITDNRVTDSQLTTSLWLNAVLGVTCFTLFCILQRSVSPLHYRFRLVSGSVTSPPKELAVAGWRSLIDWLHKALSVSEQDILASVGLDAMVMIKALSTGMMIFGPLALLGCTILLPIHYQYKSFENRDINRSQLMQLTIAALPKGSNLMWVHFVLIVVYNIWAMFVLFTRTKEFVFVRQHYLVRGDDPNYWLKQTRQEKAAEMFIKVQQLLAEVRAEKDRQRKAAEAAAKAKKDSDEPPPPAAALAASPPLQVHESAMSTTSLKNFGNSLKASWNTGMQNMWNFTRKNLLRTSGESYKPYTDESTPAASPPVMSPHGSSLGSAAAAHQQLWGSGAQQLQRSRVVATVGNSLHSASDGAESAGEGSTGDGIGSPPAAASGGSNGNLASLTGLTGSKGGGADSSTAVAAAAATAAAAASGSLSSGSSRRWSSSSGGASDSGAAGAAELVGTDFGARRLRVPGKASGRGSRGGAKTLSMGGGGVPPTHQTINELHTMSLPSPAVRHDPTWSLINSNHMRTITEDSLEYRLECSQGNTSRPSSRGGVGSGIGHHRGSSAGTGDLSAASPSSVGNSLHCRTPTSALSASIAAAGLGDSSSRSHRHSHSHSGGSGTAGVVGNVPVSPSPLSRATSANGQPPGNTVGVSSNGGGQQQGYSMQNGAGLDLSARGSVDSFAPSSVCTRITHNSSSGRSSPADPDDRCSSSEDNDGSSRRSSSMHRSSSSPQVGAAGTSKGGSVPAASPHAADTETASMSSSESAAVRDISFGGGLPLSQQTQQQLGLSLQEIHLSGLADMQTPTASPAPDSRQTGHARDSSVDFAALRHTGHMRDLTVDWGALHLQDLSRAETPLSPEDGGLLSPEPLGRRRRVTPVPVSNGRWSPFASCEQIASTIAAAGVAQEDARWTPGAQRVQGTQSDPVGTAPSRVAQLQESQSNKQRFRRPGPGWQPPSAGGAVHQLSSEGLSSLHQQQQQQHSHFAVLPSSTGQPQQVQQQRPAQAAVAGAAIGAGDIMAGSLNNKYLRPNAVRPGSSQELCMEASSAGIPGQSTTGPASLMGRSLRQRVPGPHYSSSGGAHIGRNSSEPSPSMMQQHVWHPSGWQQQSWQQPGSRGTGSTVTSNSGHSRIVSPFASTQATPRDSRDPVAGAAVGAGQMLTASAVAAVAAAAAAGTAAIGNAPVSAQNGATVQISINSQQQYVNADPPVAYHWWKEIPIKKVDSAVQLVNAVNAVESKASESGDGASMLQVAGHEAALTSPPLPAEMSNDIRCLAKPSVRYRKTINVADRWGNEMGVGAQHYAVLVTDVWQWPYPELQIEYEIKRRGRLQYKAWKWFTSLLSKVPQSLSWGLGSHDKPWNHFGENPLFDELATHEQVPLVQPGNKPSDRHSLDIPALPAAADAAAADAAAAAAVDINCSAGSTAAAAAAAVCTSGGASGVVGRGSKGQAVKGQMGSCATSSEGIGGVAGGNPLSRGSMGSHVSHISQIVDLKGVDMKSMDPDELNACTALELASMKEQLPSIADPVVRQSTTARIAKLQADMARMQAQDRQQALSREQSMYHLNAVSRSTSYARLPGPGSTGAPALMTASRASSFRSSRHLNAGPGAAANMTDWSNRGTVGGPAGSRAQTPASLQASSDAGSYGAAHAAGQTGVAGGSSTGTPRGPVAVMNAAQQRQQTQSSLHAQRAPVESPRLPEVHVRDGALSMYNQGGQAAAAAAGPGALIMALSEPLTAAALREHTALHQQLSQPTAQHMQAAVTTATVAAGQATAIDRPGSTGSHGMLLGELSMESPSGKEVGAAAALSLTGDAVYTARGESSIAIPGSQGYVSPQTSAALAAPNCAASGAVVQEPTDSWLASAASAAGGSGLPPVHHRRYVYRSAAPSGVSPDLLQQQVADAAGMPPGSYADNADKLYWSSTPQSPGNEQQQPATIGQEAAAGAPQSAAATQSAEAAGPVQGPVATSQPPARSTGGGTFAGVAGMTDSYDSNASSYAARRQAVSFKPYPPDSPRALQQQAMAGAALSSSFRKSPVAGAAVGAGQRMMHRSFVSHNQLQEGAVSRMASYPVSGSSGGGAPFASGSSGGHPALATRRSRSGHLSSSQTDGSMHSVHQHIHHPDHLSITIPPVQQCPISRSGTPCGSSGGLPGSGGGVGHTAHMPWGLPADAAMLSSMSVLGSGSPVGGVRSRSALEGGRSTRWSQPGVTAERSASAGSYKAGLNSHSHAVSPLNSDQEGLIPAGVMPGAGSGFSRAASGSSCGGHGTRAAAVAGSCNDKDVDRLPNGEPDDMYCIAGEGSGSATYRRSGAELWAIVRAAFYNRDHPNQTPRLMALLEDPNYSIVTSMFKKLFPRDFDRVIPVFNHKKVDKLLMEWEATHAALQRAEEKRRRTGREPVRPKAKLGKLLCCCAVGGGCAGCNSCKDAVESCCPDQWVQIIPELEERVDELAMQIEAERRTALTTSFTGSYFVIFKSQKAAALAASAHIYAEKVKYRGECNKLDLERDNRIQVQPAPGPEEVNWQHLWMSKSERDMRSVLTWPLLLAVVLFPITLITSAASRLEYVFCPQIEPGQPTPAFVWEWYCTGKEAGESVPVFMRAVITGWVPSLLLNLWLVMVLPRLVYLLVQSEGSCFSLSALERRIGAVFFYWDIFNVFLQGTIGSTFFQQVRKIIQSPEQLPNILGAALPDSSNFFMQFIAMRALFLIWLRMCVPHGGVWQNWCHFLWCPSCCCSACNTERDSGLNYGPRTPRYGFEMGHMLLMYLIALAFAIVSPLLLPFSVVWFAFAWVAWRHNLTYVYQRKYESGGLMWVFLFSRIVMCLVIGQLFTFCVLVVRGAYWQAFLIIAFMPALTAKYYKYCHARFLRGVETLPLEFAAAAPKLSLSYPFPLGMYVPPPLQQSSWGWYPEWSKIWDGWGMPSYSL